MNKTSLEQLASEINTLHQSINEGIRRNEKKIIEIRAKLWDAWEQVFHGQWEKWCRKNLPDIPQRTVRWYMHYDPKAKSKNVHDFTHRSLKARKKASKEVRQETIKVAVANLRPLQHNWQVHQSNNQIFNWPMVDHIITDPPWPKSDKELEHYTWLAKMAQEKLKKGGVLAVQCGQVDLKTVIPIFNHFCYITTLAIVYHQSCAITGYCFLTNWRPVVLFSKGNAQLGGPVTDTVTVRTAKLLHEWQQPLEPFLKWLPALTRPGQLIADPFTCTGTIAVAAKKTGRRFVGTEINPEMVAVARKRIAECQQEEEDKEVRTSMS